MCICFSRTNTNCSKDVADTTPVGAIVLGIVHCLKNIVYSIRRFGSCLYSRLQAIGCNYADKCSLYLKISGDCLDRTRDFF
jgi:hypothetical protein